MRPLFFKPGFYCFFVSFTRTSLWFLWTPAKRAKEPTNMINMVGYTKFGFNQMCYSGTRPQVVGESCSMSTFQKRLFQLVACCGIKSWWTAGIVCCRKPLTALFSICCMPSANNCVYQHQQYVQLLPVHVLAGEVLWNVHDVVAILLGCHGVS